MTALLTLPLIGALLTGDTWQDFYLEELLLRGTKVTPFNLVRPLDTRELNLKAQAGDSLVLELLTRLESYWGKDENGYHGNIGLLFLGDSINRAFLWGRATLRAGILHMDFLPKAKLGRSKEYPTRMWRGDLTGDLFMGVGSLKWRSFLLTLGRAPLRLGGSPEHSLLFGGSGPPLDYLFCAYTFKNLRGYFGLTFLDRWQVTQDDTLFDSSLKIGSYINRLLAFHGIEGSFLRGRLRVNLAEAVIATGVNRLPPPYYLNPFSSYLAGQVQRGGGDNLAWDLSFRYYGRNFGLFGEILIDDIQYETPPTREPDQIGFLLGLNYVWRRLFLTFQYTRVNAWTYLHEGSWQNWIAYDAPLGHPYGPDFDEVLLSGLFHLGRRLDLKGELFFRRKGEPSIHTGWPIRPGGWKEFPSNSEFLWGVVERIGRISLGAVYFTPGLRIIGEVGFIKIENFEHKKGSKKSEPQFRIGIEKWGLLRSFSNP